MDSSTILILITAYILGTATLIACIRIGVSLGITRAAEAKPRTHRGGWLGAPNTRP